MRRRFLRAWPRKATTRSGRLTRGFAAAYFYHKEVAAAADLALTSRQLFAQKVSITGKRPLVCTGYATVAAVVVRGRARV